MCVGEEREEGYAVLFRRFDPRARQQILVFFFFKKKKKNKRVFFSFWILVFSF